VPLEAKRWRLAACDALVQTLEMAGASLEKVVKVNIFLAEEADFAGLNAVYREFFAKDFPARRTILANLIGGFRVEIDRVALA
jgi:2-iminobutanoate/2-iminopropanoate deaminase